MSTHALLIVYVLLALFVGFCVCLLVGVLRTKPPLRDMLARLLYPLVALLGGLLAGLAASLMTGEILVRVSEVSEKDRFFLQATGGLAIFFLVFVILLRTFGGSLREVTGRQSALHEELSVALPEGGHLPAKETLTAGVATPGGPGLTALHPLVPLILWWGFLTLVGGAICLWAVNDNVIRVCTAVATAVAGAAGALVVSPGPSAGKPRTKALLAVVGACGLFLLGYLSSGMLQGAIALEVRWKEPPPTRIATAIWRKLPDTPGVYLLKMDEYNAYEPRLVTSVSGSVEVYIDPGIKQLALVKVTKPEQLRGEFLTEPTPKDSLEHVVTILATCDVPRTPQ